MTGNTPGGGYLAPFPEPLRSQMVAQMEVINAALEDLVRTLVPDRQTSERTPGGPAATRMWASILLRSVEELVQDLAPERMSEKYGPIGEGESELGEKIAPVLSAIRGALLVLEGP